ncbi:hypothetical protein [Bacillus sp. UNCCL81]|uniref:hypothetical protein n=1 Tax=Bacillus sp. UNCCL81 TaxID=1502755 RepID=UPI0008F1526C|nr:hypothetical protein [Bacillus sp. UNCCL81]SFD75891.1 hypothetical protein SAMN02799633_04713 [Bacillus sp. UNCCL81]
MSPVTSLEPSNVTVAFTVTTGPLTVLAVVFVVVKTPPKASAAGFNLTLSMLVSTELAEKV